MIFITAKVHPYLLEVLKTKGYEYSYEPSISYTDLQQRIGSATGLIVTTRLDIDKQLLNNADNLKWIGRLGSGMERIDVEFAGSRGIQCISSPEGNSNAVAEHALALVLNLFRNICKSEKEIASGLWLRDENRGTELSGKTVGIIGFGHTGTAFAKLLSVFGVTVLAYDKYKFDFGGGYIKEATADHICKYADIISFHVPLNSETRHMGSAEFFNKTESQPIIINTSRGAVINSSDLLLALNTGKVRAAALDVLENEEIMSFNQHESDIFQQLNTHQNIILTPHIAGYTHEAFLNMSKVLIRKLDL